MSAEKWGHQDRQNLGIEELRKHETLGGEPSVSVVSRSTPPAADSDMKYASKV
jgi:hypothetical protein